MFGFVGEISWASLNIYWKQWKVKGILSVVVHPFNSWWFMLLEYQFNYATIMVSSLRQSCLSNKNFRWGEFPARFLLFLLTSLCFYVMSFQWEVDYVIQLVIQSFFIDFHVHLRPPLEGSTFSYKFQLYKSVIFQFFACL